jgi:hypothetical protein
MTERKELSPARLRAVQALVTAASFEEAVERARVRKETLWRWLAHDGAFQQALKEERKHHRTLAAMAAEALLGAAVETLEKVIQDDSQPPELRVEASRATFEIAMQLYKLTALEERIAALESWLKERKAKTAAGVELRKSAAAAERSA